MELGGNLFWLLLARRPFWGIGSAQCHKLGSELARVSQTRGCGVIGGWLPGEPRGTARADGSHRRGCVCLEEKPKYISELVKLLRPSPE